MCKISCSGGCIECAPEDHEDREEMCKQYTDEIIRLYIAGEENAYETYQRLYAKYPYESDVIFITRCAQQDFDDYDLDGLVYEDVAVRLFGKRS